MATNDVMAIVLGGGQGIGLYPLTRERAKPAVPLGGKYRLIDIPISNCLNSEINRIYILTQFLSVSLHRHISNTYMLDTFSGGFVYILAAQQTTGGMDWYQGTADAVRKHLRQFMRVDADDFLILSGDHLYRMDYRPFIEAHRDMRADVTIAVHPVPRQDASRLGILRTDSEDLITTFREKPGPDELDGLQSLSDTDRPFLGSMGVYLFRRHVLRELLESSDAEDFGRQIIPTAIATQRVCAYPFDGYWEDIGTIGAYYQAGISLTDPDPEFDFYEPEGGIYTRPRFLPPTRADGCKLVRTVLADGCLIHGSSIERSVIGLRSVIGTASVVRDTIMMGADDYDTPGDRSESRALGRPKLGIGRRCTIEGAIIDKNARIGDDVTIRKRAPTDPDAETDLYVVRDGVVVIPRNAVIPSGTVI